MQKVDVILTSYNRDTLLEESIQSVLNQSYQDFHLYIMDDDSDNSETHKVLDKYFNLNNVTVYKHKLNGIERFSRCGYGENINRAIEMSNGEYITYLTCDDIFYSDRLERMVSMLDNNKDIFVVYGIQQIVRIDDNGRRKKLRLRKMQDPVVYKAACSVDHNSVMHRRSCIEILGHNKLWSEGAKKIRAGDAFVWNRLNKEWGFHKVLGGPTDEHRFHRNSIQKVGFK